VVVAGRDHDFDALVILDLQPVEQVLFGLTPFPEVPRRRL
jgi:hypothetical protein